MATKKGLYKGFSSEQFIKTKSFEQNDVEIVKTDLLNHIFTKRGERVMLPNFGTAIPELVFEPLDNGTLEILEDELRTVFNYDPRVELLELDIQPDFDSGTVIAAARVFYIELDLTDDFTLNIEFEQ